MPGKNFSNMSGHPVNPFEKANKCYDYWNEFENKKEMKEEMKY